MKTTEPELKKRERTADKPWRQKTEKAINDLMTEATDKRNKSNRQKTGKGGRDGGK